MRFPIFMPMRSLREVAENINIPHEDKRVDDTENAIKYLIGLDPFGNRRSELYVRPYLLRTAHAMIFHDIPHKGRYRTCEVEVSGERMPEAHLVDAGVMELCSKPVQTKQDLHVWYELFERLHPFEDGNGRVGGAMLAAASKMLFGHYTVAVWLDGTQREDV